MSGKDHDDGHHGGRCPGHFSELSTEALAGVGDFRRVIDVLNRLLAHGWLTQAMLCWSAMLGRYACPRGSDPTRVTIATLSHVPGIGDLPWIRLLDMLARAAVYRDGATVHATVVTARGLADDELAQLVVSLVYSTAPFTAKSPATGRDITVMNLLGSEVDTPEQYDVIDDLADTIIGFRAAGSAGAHTSANRMTEYDLDRAVAAMTLSTSVLGHFVSEQSVVLAPTGTGGSPVPSGVLNWTDKSGDARRSVSEMATCLALRFALAYANGDSSQVSAYLREVEDPLPFAFGVTYSAAGLLARTLAFIERQPVDLPPGHPG